MHWISRRPKLVVKYGRKRKRYRDKKHIRDQKYVQRMSCYRLQGALCAARLGVGNQFNVVLQFKSSLGVVLSGNKVHNEGVLDGEDGVVVQVLVLAVKDLGSQRAVAFLGCLCEYISLRIQLQTSQMVKKLTMM